jgi:hypothetical protein
MIMMIMMMTIMNIDILISDTGGTEDICGK